MNELDKSVGATGAIPAILLVEDNAVFAGMLRRSIEETLAFTVVWKQTCAAALEAIASRRDAFMVALVNLSPTNSSSVEIIEYAAQQGLPSILFTGELDCELRSRFLKWSVVDYILKKSRTGIDSLLDILRRIEKNRHHTVLVVDDSRSMREAVARVLRARLFNVLEATNGNEALERLAANPGTKLLVTDYDMPGMNGIELIQRVREMRSRNKLAIIGMSAAGNPLLSARLLKAGADDFVSKPFQVEEFHCRVGHAIEILEHIALIRELSYKDPLTRLYNRRYFFEHCAKAAALAEASGLRLAVAMLDIDFFKKINDTYGHGCGDAVLRAISDTILARLPEQSIACRFGGEEFCVLLPHAPEADVPGIFNALCRSIEAMEVVSEGRTMRTTVSIGIALKQEAIESMLKRADDLLYEAKDSGRNRIVSD